jgi:hypothetical protein
MRYLALALAFCFALTPLEATARKPKVFPLKVVKAKKNKVKARKAPKQAKPHSRVN